MQRTLFSEAFNHQAITLNEFSHAIVAWNGYYEVEIPSYRWVRYHLGRQRSIDRENGRHAVGISSGFLTFVVRSEDPRGIYDVH